MPETQFLAGLDVDDLREWVENQRWYASKSRHVTSVELLESATLGDAPPQLILALLQTGFATGTHELYQLPLGLRPAGTEVDGAIVRTWIDEELPRVPDEPGRSAMEAFGSEMKRREDDLRRQWEPLASSYVRLVREGLR